MGNTYRIPVQLGPRLVDRQTIEDNGFDIKAVNPNRRVEQDTRTPAELIALIEEKQTEIMAALAELKQ